uniref:Uncharacterized protein n=1 Tax=Manihot esculenta TaxID=3983 RepID=A0A2C9WNQ1_MANES
MISTPSWSTGTLKWHHMLNRPILNIIMKEANATQMAYATERSNQGVSNTLFHFSSIR